jgi:hypothetical protein
MRSFITIPLMAATVSAICGCSSLVVKHSEPDRAAIEQRYSGLVLSHGVSREDSVVVAQHYMLSKGYDYDWWIESPTKIDDDPQRNTWTVEFAPKEDGYGSGPRHRSELTLQMLLPYWVTINKDSGKISVVVVQTKHK